MSAIVTNSAMEKATGYLPKTDGRFLITMKNYPSEQGHKYYLVDDKKGPERFLMVSGEHLF